MSDLISRQALRDAMYHEAFETDTEMQRWDSGCWIRYKLFENIIDNLPSAEPKWNNHTVACLLAELFEDSCACNYCGIDEWLPEKCEVIDSCPNPVGVACWEQFLTHRKENQ